MTAGVSWLEIPDGLPEFVGYCWPRVCERLDTLRNDEVLVAKEPDGNYPIELLAELLDALPPAWRARLEEHGLVPLPPFPSRVLLSIALTGALVGIDILTTHPRRIIA